MDFLQHQEEDLIEKAKAGDVKSFEILIANYKKRAFNIAYRMLGNLEDANDVTQESFLKIYRSIDKFKGKSSFSTWLYSIVSNTCIDFIRRNRKKTTISIDTNYDEDGYEIEIADEKNTTESLFEKKEIIRSIHDAINRLNHDQKIVIILRDIQGFSYFEISKILNISEGTVKSRISRGRKNLKNILEEMLYTNS